MRKEYGEAGVSQSVEDSLDKTSGDSVSAEQHWKQLTNPASRDEFVRSWLILQCQSIGNVLAGVVLTGPPDEGPFTPIAIWPDASTDISSLTQAAQQAIVKREGLLVQGDDDNSHSSQIAYPIEVSGHIYGVVVLNISSADNHQIKEIQRQLHWGAGRLVHAFTGDSVKRTQDIINNLVLNLDLIAVTEEQKEFESAARVFVTELATRMGFDRASMGFVKGKRIEVCAVSHSSRFKEKANILRLIGDAMDEAYDQHTVVTFPVGSDQEFKSTRCAEELVRHNGGGSVCVLPLMDAEQLVGALVLESDDVARFDVSTLELTKTVASLLGPLLCIQKMNDRGILTRVQAQLRELLHKLIGPRHAVFKLVTFLACVLVGFLFITKGEYRVTADASLEGRVLRTAVAPFAGYIENAQVRAGDIVNEGQLLVELNDDDLKIEEQKWISRQRQLINELREAKAEHEWGAIGVFDAQINQAKAELQLIKEKLIRSRIVAPFDGIVVSGDLSQSLGAPVERGDILFEVAPLDVYRVALEVDEWDIDHVAIGQTGTLSLTSMPNQDYSITIETITPIATSMEGHNFFKVEARLEGSSKRLRPGMEGIAKVAIEQRRLIWIWTHKVIDWFRLWVWSWWP